MLIKKIKSIQKNDFDSFKSLYVAVANALFSFFFNMTKPSITGESGMYSSDANSARSPTERRTGVEWVWDPAIVLGVPAFPITSTAYKIIHINISAL